MLFVHEKEKYLSTLKLFCHTCACQLYTEGHFLQSYYKHELWTIVCYMVEMKTNISFEYYRQY